MPASLKKLWQTCKPAGAQPAIIQGKRQDFD
jgi:hypothetical protein